MAFKIGKGGKWQDSYSFLYYPASINPQQVKKKIKEVVSQPSRQFPNNIVERDEASTNKKKKFESFSVDQNEANRHVEVLTSESFLDLNTAFSYSSLHNPDLLFKGNSIYYSSGSILVRKDITGGSQIFMKGHSDFLVAMDSIEDWIVTVQEGIKSSVRIWIDHKCVCSFQSPYEKVQQLRLNFKKHLAMVGLDAYKRQAILVFDISEIEITKKPVLIAKQISDFNILTLKFSPTESDKLVSCGRQNIRFWRIKNQHMPGSPVILNHHARNTIFTVLDFELAYDQHNPYNQNKASRVFVGSQSGLLFQVNYQTHQLQQVYKLHQNATISSLAVGDGFCITGGTDQLIRVWKMDFSQYVLQANNDGVVASLTLSEDGSQVACGTSSGVLSVLDLTTNNYRSIVRSHTENVKQITYHQYSNCIISLSSDLTIRLWDTDKLDQTYEFSYPQSDLCYCISGNPRSLHFAAGFQSGTLRIFDIQNTCVIEEIKHHQNPIVWIQYSPDGRYLAVLQDKGSMLYSPLHSHQPIKHMPCQLPSKYKHSCFSQDSQALAVIGDSGTHINIWQLKSLQLKGKIFTGKIIKKLKFEGEKLWALFEDTSIRRYNVVKMTIEVEMQALHRNSLNGIAFNLESHLLFSVGDDSFVKVWDYSFLREPHQVYFGHAKTINDVIFHKNLLWTAGSQGLFVWNFTSHGQTFIEPPIFPKEKKATFIKNQVSQQRNVETQLQASKIDHKQEGNNEENKIIFSNLIKKTYDKESSNKFVPVSIKSDFLPKTITFKRNKKRQPKPRLSIDLPQQNIELNLPLRHFFRERLEPGQLQYLTKIDSIKSNNKKLKLQYLLGVQSTAHDHIVWNFMYGWYAYIYDNLIIVQSLNKARSQKIITMPEKLSALALTKDFKRLICSSQFNPVQSDKNKQEQNSGQGSDADSSEGEQAEGKQNANIYVLGGDFAIEKKLEFHSKGVQALRISDNGKFLVSIGNFRECTIGVWELATGKLKTSTFTLQRNNDIAISKKASEKKPLQFATVGRDQIHLWSYGKDQKLDYRDIFIKGDEDNQIPQITTCDYLHYHETEYLMFGTDSGELGILNLQDHQVIWRKKICSSQILAIRCCRHHSVIGSEDGNLYYWNYDVNILEANPTPSFNKINLTYSVNGLFLDDDGTEGVVSTSQAIYYVNINQQFHSLLVGSPVSPVIFCKVVSGYLLTSHQNGRLKLWNLQTAQELKTYRWKYPCTQAYFDESIGKLVCLCANQTVKIVNLKKFTKEEVFLSQEAVKNDKVQDFVLLSNQVSFGNKPARWNFHSKGNVYSFSITQQGKRKSIKSEKVLELGYNVRQVQVNPDKNVIVVNSEQGTVYCYNVEFSTESQNHYSLILLDKALNSQFSSNKHQTDQPAEIKIVLSKVLNQTYAAISKNSETVFLRNYMKRIIFQRISLPSLPTSILLIQSKKQSQVIVGTKEGALIRVNAIDLEQRSKFEGIVNNSVNLLCHAKTKNWLLLGHPSAVSIYDLSQS